MPPRTLEDSIDDVRDLQLDIALVKKDVEQVKSEISEIKADIKLIKSYFIRATIGVVSIVGLYLVQWILNGGLSHVVQAASR